MIQSKTLEQIKRTREYLEYIEEHINNIHIAFDEVTKACSAMSSIADDYGYFKLKSDIESHDISKLSKEEFTDYRDKFYPVSDSDPIDLSEDAWSHHLEHNDHHWESIMLGDRSKQGDTERKLMHMVIDWTAMSYKFGGSAEEYYYSQIDYCDSRNSKIKLGISEHNFIIKVFENIRRNR